MIVVVFGNIAAWLVEKFIPWSFEFLSVSYLFSEVLLFTIYWMMQDISPAKPVDIATMSIEDTITKCLSVITSGEILSSREREILELVRLHKKRKEIADELCLSENTIKTYTRTLYGKLGVSSRDELYALLVK